MRWYTYIAMYIHYLALGLLYGVVAYFVFVGLVATFETLFRLWTS